MSFPLVTKFFFKLNIRKAPRLVESSGAFLLSVVIRNFVPPKFRKVRQPENGKVKQPTKYTIN